MYTHASHDDKNDSSIILIEDEQLANTTTHWLVSALGQLGCPPGPALGQLGFHRGPAVGLLGYPRGPAVGLLGCPPGPAVGPPGFPPVPVRKVSRQSFIEMVSSKLLAFEQIINTEWICASTG